MKRIAIVILMLVSAAAASAASYWTVVIDGQPIAAELPPIPIGNGALLVSARSLFSAMQAHYDYDASSARLKAVKGSVTIEMIENVNEATVNGHVVRMPVAPQRQSGVMMVPIPFTSQLLGYTTQTDATSKTLTLTGGGPSTAPAVASNGDAPPNRVAPGHLVPSALPYLMTGNLPPGNEFATVQPMPGMPSNSSGAQATSPPSAQMQVQGPWGPQLPQVENPVALPAVDTRMPLANSWPTVDNGAPPSYELPPAAGGSAGAPVLHAGGPVSYQTPQTGYPMTSSGMGGTDSPNPYVTSAGKMDSVDPLDNFYDADRKPDPAVTGLTIERRYDSFVSAYAVHYRVTNLGGVPTDKQMLVRLRMGGSNGMQTVQNFTIDRLEPNQSLTYDWSGDARTYPFLYDVTIKAEAAIVLDDQAQDANHHNNARTVKISY